MTMVATTTVAGEVDRQPIAAARAAPTGQAHAHPEEIVTTMDVATVVVATVVAIWLPHESGSTRYPA
jgi:hypothetical protein